MQLIEDQNEWPAAIQTLANAANDPPSAIDAAGIPDDFQNDLTAADDSCSDQACYDAACKAAAAARTNQWHTDMVQWDTAERNFFAAYYQYATGLASNLSISSSYQQALIQARSIGDAIIGSAQGLPNTAWAWADTLNGYDGDGGCLNAATSADNTSAGSDPSSSICSAADKALKATLNLEVLTISVECEKFTVEASTGPVGLFAEASYNTRSGQTTVFAGAKAGAELPSGFGTSSKSGMYVTTGSDGSIVDCGARFGTGASTGSAVSLNASDSMDFSFMPSATGGSLFDS